MVPPEVDRHVDVDDVAVAQRPPVGDAVADDLVHAGAHAPARACACACADRSRVCHIACPPPPPPPPVTHTHTHHHTHTPPPRRTHALGVGVVVVRRRVSALCQRGLMHLRAGSRIRECLGAAYTFTTYHKLDTCTPITPAHHAVDLVRGHARRHRSRRRVQHAPSNGTGGTDAGYVALGAQLDWGSGGARGEKGSQAGQGVRGGQEKARSALGPQPWGWAAQGSGGLPSQPRTCGRSTPACCCLLSTSMVGWPLR